MSTCKDMRAKMLTANVPVLLGEGDDPLARHIAGCAACAGAARLMLSDVEALEGVFGAAPPELDMDALLARVAGAEPASATSAVRGARRRHRTASLSRWTRWSAVALAASLATLLLVTHETGMGPGGRSAPAPTAASTQLGPPPTVESAPGRDVAVIPTDNPNITVVWYF